MKDETTSLKYVDHTYHDFSNYIIEGGELTKHKKSHNNFPARLHRLLSSGHDDVITWMVCALYLLSCVWPPYYRCAYHVFAHIICFPHIILISSIRIFAFRQPHGRAWKIIDRERLVSEVIPNYYVCKKYESFTRQLNGWGFKRLYQNGPGMCAIRVPR